MRSAVHSWDKLRTPQITIMYLETSVSLTALGNSKKLCFPIALAKCALQTFIVQCLLQGINNAYEGTKFTLEVD